MIALSEILAQNPSDAFARYGLAIAHAAEGNHEQALIEYSTLLNYTPGYVPAYQMSAQLLLQIGRLEEARSRLAEGISIAEKSGNAHAASEMQAMLEDLTS